MVSRNLDTQKAINSAEPSLEALTAELIDNRLQLRNALRIQNTSQGIRTKIGNLFGLNRITKNSDSAKDAVGEYIAGTLTNQEARDAYRAKVLTENAGLATALEERGIRTDRILGSNTILGPRRGIKGTLINPDSQASKTAVRAYNFLYNSPEFAADTAAMSRVVNEDIQDEESAQRIRTLVELQKAIDAVNIGELKAIGSMGEFDLSTRPIGVVTPGTGKLGIIFNQQLVILRQQFPAPPPAAPAAAGGAPPPPAPAPVPDNATMQALQSQFDALQAKADPLIAEAGKIDTAVKTVEQKLKSLGYKGSTPLTLANYETNIRTALSHSVRNPLVHNRLFPQPLIEIKDLLNDTAEFNELRRYNDRFATMTGKKAGGKLPAEQFLREAIILGRYGSYKELDPNESSYINNIMSMVQKPLVRPDAKTQMEDEKAQKKARTEKYKTIRAARPGLLTRSGTKIAGATKWFYNKL